MASTPSRQDSSVYVLSESPVSGVPLEIEWFDREDFLESRAFYEIMQAYRHTPVDGGDAFEHVKACLRQFYRPADKATAVVDWDSAKLEDDFHE